jgi:2,5-diketo-D-gluconate reductase B
MNIFFQKTYQRAFGTFPLKGDELKAALRCALDAGYRAIDTAQMYGNEVEVGAALREATVPRAELCITTKVHPDAFSPERFLPSVQESLEKLQVEQADVLLLHWPPIEGSVVPSLKLLEQAQRQGLAKHIGVSNYTAAMMRTARETVSVPIVTNQVEFHPLLDQSKLLAAASETGIPLSSYCSVARGEVFKHTLFGEIGAGYGRSAAQVVLRWILQRGLPINTMSTKAANIRANFDVMDFTLSSIDMDRIDALTRTGYRIVDKNLVPWAPAWD